MCDGEITFTNTGTEAVGNIHYRTYYVSETGVVRENSIMDAVIEKLIQPGQTRTIKLEKFVVPVDCEQAGINITSCEVLAQFTTKTVPHGIGDHVHVDIEFPASIRSNWRQTASEGRSHPS